MRINTKSNPLSTKTHGGAIAAPLTPEQALRRSVMACLLWENEFYESGMTIAKRIAELVPQVKSEKVAEMAVDARIKMKLRHVPLLLVNEMTKHESHRRLVAGVLRQVIRRADEPGELIAMYWADGGRRPLPAQVKKGLAEAFTRFDAYQLAKYDRPAPVSLRDVMFLVHPKPTDQKQAMAFTQLAERSLKPADTWEVALSSGKGRKSESDKRAHWGRLLAEGKLGALALLRNLRNMEQAGVATVKISQALRDMNAQRVLPFRYLAAAREAPRFEPELEDAMLRSLGQMPKLKGSTVLVIDVSGSMYAPLSRHSKLNRLDTAAALTVLARELCEHVVVYATAGSDWKRKHKTALLPARRGFAMSEAVHNSAEKLGGGGIFLKQAMGYIAEREMMPDRVIVLTDEQDCDDRVKGNPADALTIGQDNYLINVASAKNGIGYGRWTHVDGWSEAVFDFIHAIEQA